MRGRYLEDTLPGFGALEVRGPSRHRSHQRRGRAWLEGARLAETWDVPAGAVTFAERWSQLPAASLPPSTVFERLTIRQTVVWQGSDAKLPGPDETIFEPPR
jgi:hypothetical protein